MSLYCMQCNRPVIALLYHYAVAIVVKAIVGKDDNDATMEIKGVTPVTMVIMTVLRRWRSQAQDDDGHIISLISIACDVYLLCIYLALIDGSIIR